jgi:hypothetical protein
MSSERRPEETRRRRRWLAAALTLIALAGCEHGELTFDRTTGQFRLPIGGGSREPGTNR